MNIRGINAEFYTPHCPKTKNPWVAPQPGGNLRPRRRLSLHVFLWPGIAYRAGADSDTPQEKMITDMQRAPSRMLHPELNGEEIFF